MPNKSKRKQNVIAKEIAMGGIMVALALIFSYIEFLMPINIGIPGVKIGLANLVIIICLYTYGIKFAFMVSIIRILLSSILFSGLFAAIYSLMGGVISLIGMWALKKRGKFSIFGVSVAGATLHNLGQLVTAALIIWNIKLFVYFPVLIFSGIVGGLLIALISSLIIKKTAPLLGRNNILD